MQCICCQKKLKEFVENQPYDGVHIKTFGHYGSTIIDSMSGDEWLDLFICDKCLDRGIKRGYVKRSFEQNNSTPRV